MAYQFSKMSVLVVENNNAMFDLTKGVLASFGVGKVISAYDVESGFRKYCLNEPDLVIVDWLNGDMNGVELTRLIRTSAKSPDAYVPIIMMTGFSQKRRVMMARDAGITEFVVKPYTATTLYQKIESIIENPRRFVKSTDFFGPDRRRHGGEFQGEDRRKDRSKDIRTPSQKARQMQENISKGPKDS